MTNSQRQKNNNIYTLGFKSKFAERIWNHPWFTLLFFYFFTGVIFLCVEKNIEKIIWALEVMLPFEIGPFVLVRYFHRNSCYKVVIDNNQNIIKFYLMFNKGVVDAKMNDVKVLIDNHFNFELNGRRISLFYNYLIRDVIALLPESTEIKFVGFFGRWKEKELIREKKEGR